jgi:hypothetical protein
VIDLTVAEHEAAHLVVGVALGLRLRHVVVKPSTWRGFEIAGYTWFATPGNKIAHGIVACAGMVWESRPGGKRLGAAGDRKLAREYLRTASAVKTGCRVAAEILTHRKRAHRRVVREICEHAKLGPRDIERLVLE